MVSCFSPDSQLPSRGLTSFLHLLLTSYQPTNVCTPCHRSLWFCCQAFTQFGSKHICIGRPGWFFLQLSYVCNWFHWIIMAKWQLWTNAYNWVRFRYIYPLTLSLQHCFKSSCRCSCILEQRLKSSRTASRLKNRTISAAQLKIITMFNIKCIHPTIANNCWNGLFALQSEELDTTRNTVDKYDWEIQLRNTFKKYTWELQ